ncbi:MAG: hypothetical protein HY063_11050 [Bacteroidetes bacterium]|nr:hypothetical protein [Bacteroidota bacterium]
MKTKIFLSISAIALMFIFSCKKGDTGPAGATGTAGAAGNANVQTYTFSVTSASWAADTVDQEWSSDYTLPSAANVSGAVLCYAQDGSNWSALPHVDYGVAFSFSYDPSTKIIEVVAADAKAASMVPNPGAMTFRVVTIPTAKVKANPTLNWKSYEEVKTKFNL